MKELVKIEHQKQRVLTTQQLAEVYETSVDKRSLQLYLWTEKGADRHCKIFDTDKAWKQFDNIEETYFKVKEAAINLSTTLPQALRAYADEVEKMKLLNCYRMMDFTSISNEWSTSRHA